MLFGTFWKLAVHVANLIGNKMGTPKSVPLPLRPERKKDGPSWVHVEPSHLLCEFYVPKIVCHHVLHGLTPFLKRVGT
jgi:hypothetical protein